MKKKLHFLFLLPLVIPFFISCTMDNPTGQRGSSGKTLELLVAADKDVFRGEIEEEVDSIFSQPINGLNQRESVMDVVYIPQSSLNNTEMFRVHRNILIIDKKPENDNKVYIHRNHWSYPQIVFEFAVTDNKHFLEMLPKYYPQMMELIYQTERIRLNKSFKSMENTSITKQLKENFGFWVTVTSEFKMATLNKEFAWMRKETKYSSQGIIVYTMPYRDSSIFQQENILALRDKITKQYIPGPADGSYMTSEKRADFFTKKVSLNGYEAMETRGLWRLIGDFMGGPFVNYVLLDKKNSRIIMIDGYVYSPHPRKPKRDLLMQLESVAYSLTFL